MRRFSRQPACRPLLAGLALALLCFGVIAATGLAAGKSKFNKVLAVGDAAPEWMELPGIDDKSHSLADWKEAKLLVVVFTSNICPISRIYEERLLALAKKFAEKKVQVVAINVGRNEADGLANMKRRAETAHYPFPYLRDESQKTGKAYGATNTPHFFLLDADRKIAYMGAFDDNLNADKVEKRYLNDAIEALLSGQAPPVKESLQQGCPIEYE